MSFAEKIVIHSKTGVTSPLEHLVEQFVADGVKLVAVAGTNCSLIEEIIDEIVVGDGCNDQRFIITTSHPGESLDEVIEFARSFTEGTGEPQLVEL